MNKAQRERLNEALGILEAVAEEEREKFDNMSEYFPDSEKTERLGENADNLDEAIGYIVEVAEV